MTETESAPYRPNPEHHREATAYLEVYDGIGPFMISESLASGGNDEFDVEYSRIIPYGARVTVKDKKNPEKKKTIVVDEARLLRAMAEIGMDYLSESGA